MPTLLIEVVSPEEALYKSVNESHDFFHCSSLRGKYRDGTEFWLNMKKPIERTLTGYAAKQQIAHIHFIH